MSIIIKGSRDDVHGTWQYLVESITDILGYGLKLTVTQPDNTIETRNILEGFTEGDVTNAGGAAQYLDTVVIPSINSSVTGIVKAYQGTPAQIQAVYSMLGTAEPVDGTTNPPQLKPV